MKKILWIPFVLLLVLTFISCAEDSTSMNEDYAGTWYYSGIFDNKLEMSDTSFVQYIYADGYGYYNFYKGTLSKQSDSTVEMLVTHEYGKSDWVEKESTPQIVSYSLSSDGHTLTFDGSDFSDSEPSH